MKSIVVSSIINFIYLLLMLGIGMYMFLIVALQTCFGNSVFKVPMKRKLSLSYLKEVLK